MEKDIHEIFADTWALLRHLSVCDLQMTNEECAVQSDSYQRKIARCSCDFLEQDFFKQVALLAEESIDAFAIYEKYVRQLLSKANDQALNYVYRDDKVQHYPFANAFFMFRSGKHKLAIDYLKLDYQDDRVQRFGDVYSDYFN